jgi:hypothetical protein
MKRAAKKVAVLVLLAAAGTLAGSLPASADPEGPADWSVQVPVQDSPRLTNPDDREY